MATVPQFLGPDGVLRDDLIFSTTMPSRFFTGTIAANTVDLQVSIRGGEYTSDPDFVVFEGTEFTVPNPASYPDGLDLVAGNNDILLRAVDTSGSVSAPAQATVRLVQESALGLIVQAPTAITLERLDTTIRVTVEGVDTGTFRGINFYGSSSPGGGTDGYYPLNVKLVTDYDITEEVTALGRLEVDADILLGTDDEPAADPLYFRVVGTQEDEDEAVLQTDFNERLGVDETVRKLRTRLTVSSVREVQLFRFEHNRLAGPNDDPATIPRSEFSSLPETDPIYYVAKAVFYDSVNQVELESTGFSPEVLGYPLQVSTGLGSLPVVSRDQISQQLELSIFRSQPDLSMQPGSVIRDTFIDPGSAEIARVRFLVDFIHRAQSFPDLLRIDDPALSGDSVPISQSAYKLNLKQALQLVQNADVQSVIDQAFEKLASRFGKTRLPGLRARGEVTFYTTTRPTASIPIPIGSIVSGGGRRFRTTEAAEITLENIATFFSGTTGRYSVRVSIQAEDPGSSGNLSNNQIRTIVSGPSGLSVVNESRTFGGTDRESNRDLAVRTQYALASVDTGTEAGLLQVAAGVPGVSEIRVIPSGDDYMQRDFDPATKTHRGGKVDIWVRGTQVNTITDAFAFSFDIENDVLFEVVGDPLNLRFKALSLNLSSTNPIIEMLDIPSRGFGFRNDTTGFDFDLTGVTIEDYNIIVLDTSIPQPSVALTDIVRGDIRYRDSDRFTFPRQPVTRINFLRGSVTGTVDSTVYSLKRLADPLVLGRSTIAGDYLLVTDTEDAELTIPSGDPVVITSESHVLIGETVEYLNNLGINPLTIRVYNSTRTTEYNGPFDPSSSIDYTILDGDQENPVAIVRTETGSIASGAEVLVDYDHDENFVVSYDSNFLVTAAQEDLDNYRHTTADILAKESVINRVNLSATIVLSRGQRPATVDSAIRTNLENYMRGLGMDAPLRPSDVVGIIEGTAGVSFVILPLTKMVRDEDSLIIREGLVSDQDVDYQVVSEWSTESVQVYLLRDGLSNATTDGGGSEDDFRGVVEDDVALDLQTVQPEALGNGAGRAYIIGNDGLVIPGVSDDDTLIAAGYVTESAINEQRLALTANHVLVSLALGDTPVSHEYAVTYLVGVDSGVKRIEAGVMESLSLGTLTFTFDEDR
jgi:hypothetical protein